MSNIYYDQINRMAEAKWKGPKHYSGKPNITADNFPEWKEHWLNTAYEWRNKLSEENLEKTVEYLNQVIMENER